VITVVLPPHLRALARISGSEVAIEITGESTLRALLDSVEARFPELRGTFRDRATGARRPFIRYFACKRDFSHEPPETPLPNAVINGDEPFLIVGAMAGG